MSLGFSAVALPQMQNQNATFHVSESEASWIGRDPYKIVRLLVFIAIHSLNCLFVSASLASISTPIGCLLTGVLLDRFGRRSTLLLLNLPCVLGWLLIAFASGSSTLGMIYAGRIFTGIA